MAKAKTAPKAKPRAKVKKQSAGSKGNAKKYNKGKLRPQKEEGEEGAAKWVDRAKLRREGKLEQQDEEESLLAAGITIDKVSPQTPKVSSRVALTSACRTASVAVESLARRREAQGGVPSHFGGVPRAHLNAQLALEKSQH